MKIALFIAGAAMVSAQCDVHAPASSCLAANNCTFYAASCQLTNSSFKCDTSSMTTCGESCVAGAMIMDYQTCSKCGPSCTTLTTEATCEANAVCGYVNSSCYPSQTLQPTPARVCGSTTKTGCVAEDNCAWAELSVNACGAAAAGGMCLPCGTFPVDYRSALKNNIGQSCTHAKTASFAFAFSYTIKDFAQNAMCSATTNVTNATADMTTLATIAKWKFALINPYGSLFYDAASEIPTCVAAPAESGASMLLPSAAFLTLAALLA